MRETTETIAGLDGPPTWAVRLAAPIIGTDAEIPLTGRKCVPRRLPGLGFTFRHADLSEALDDALRPG